MRTISLMALALGALLPACGGDFTAQEHERLSSLLLAPLPPSPSNAWADNPAAAALGQQFFFDPRFSGPIVVDADSVGGGLGRPGEAGRVACASCHDPEQGGTDHRSRGATSLATGWTGRNAPTVINSAYSLWQFWDGRKDSLWSQALGPIESPVEHNTSRLRVVHLIAEHYRAPYERVFGRMPDMSDLRRFPADGHPGTPAFDSMSEADRDTVNRVYSHFGKAIEAYERLLTDRDSPFDRYMAGDHAAMSPAAVRGAKLFVGRASCDECHRGPALSDNRFHNHAIPQVGPTVPERDPGRDQGIRDVLGDIYNQAGAYSDARGATHLRGLEPGPLDLGAFKTPPLRNVTRTAPFMHTGGLRTLWDVVLWYRDAAGTDGFVGVRDPAVRPLNLSNSDLEDLVEFLKSLDGQPLPAQLVRPPVLP